MPAHKTIAKTDAYDAGMINPAISVFVTAHAGSGKTRQLSERVLTLLLYGVAPEKILCLTFTNAAAAEMRQRVLESLGAWVMAEEKALHDALLKLLGRAPDKDMTARARSLFALVLDAPEGVRIQTIHGFCQSLLRRFPVEASVSPHFTVMETGPQQEMLREARARLFQAADDANPPLKQAIAALAQLLNASDFQELLDAIVTQKFKFRELFLRPGGKAAATEELWRRLGVASDATEESLVKEYFCYDDDTRSSLRHAAGILAEGKDKDMALSRAINAWLALAPGARMAKREEYVQTFLTQTYTKRKSLCTKGLLDDASLTLLLAEQERVVNFHNARRALQAGRVNACVIEIADALLRLYEDIKQAHARMDYNDLILTARDLLTQPGISPWVLFKLDGGIDHVLVDEAQDTSPEQWQIIDALTGDFFAGASRSENDRSLFIVGDEKQSIFSFQGADVKQLAKMHRYFHERIEAAGKEVRTQTLDRSFRSTPEILQAVDAVFALPEVRAGVLTGEEPLSHTAHRAAAPGMVELWPLVIKEEEGKASPKSQLTHHIADTIQQWLAEGRWLEDKGRAVEPGDIMILLQTRTGFADRLVRALKRRGVPVAGVDRMVLKDNLAVQDLMALGKCLLLPEDDLTLAALLKSPIGAIGEDELFALAWGRGDESLWRRLEKRAADSKPCAEAYALLSDLRGKADFLPPYELYAYLLDTLGVRRRFTGRMGEEYGDPIDEFLSQALAYQKDNTASLQGFLHWLESGDSEIKRDMEQSKRSVRVMTVHGAKGLQSPIVIMPDTTDTPTIRDRLLWHGNEAGELPLWLSSEEKDDVLTRHAREERKTAMFEEYRRLLYVAMTRAEDHLILCGALSKGESAGEQSWYAMAARALTPLGKPCATPAGEGMRIGLPPPAKGKPALKEESKAVAGDFSYLFSPPLPEVSPPKPLAPSKPDSEPAAASPLMAEAYTRGLFIHALLQHLPDASHDERRSVARSLAATHRTRMKASEITTCIDESLAIIEHPDFAPVFAKGSRAEAPVAGIVQVKGKPFVVSGQVDRLAVGERDVWIVDYKTNRLPPAAGEPPPSAYVRQMALYRLLLAHIYPEKTIRCVLLWTVAPRMDVLDGTLMDSYI